MRRLLNIKHPSVVEWLVEGDITMATVEYWIQIENRPWDVSPHNIDRITGQDLKEREGKDPVDVVLSSPATGHTRTVKMFKPFAAGRIGRSMR